MESDEQKAARQLDERFADARERERHLSDFLVRYLTTVNAGGIGAMLTLGGTFGKANFTSFAWLAVPFALGLVCAGLALFIEHHRQNEASNMASKLRTKLTLENATVDELMKKWNTLADRQTTLPWRNATWASAIFFVIGMGLGMWVLICCLMEKSS